MERQEKYEVATRRPELGIVQTGLSLFFDIARFEHAQRIAKLLSFSTMVPEQFQGGEKGIANCLIALNLAERMRVDPFMLMQTMYIVHGRPGIEAKLAIALFNDGTKRFDPPLQYEKEGDYPKGKDARCRAYATDVKSGKPLYGEWIDWDMIKGEGWDSKNGSKWKTMPGQMFIYRAAMFFIREYEPGVLLGLRTKDELEDMVIDVTPRPALTLKPEGEPAGDPYEVKDTTKEPTPEKQDKPQNEEKPNPEPEPAQTDKKEAPEPQNGNGPTIVCTRKGNPRVYVMKNCAICPQAEECPSLAAYHQQEGESQSFQKRVADAEKYVGPATIAKILRTKFKVKDIKDLKPDKREEFLKAVNEEIDKSNA